MSHEAVQTVYDSLNADQRHVYDQVCNALHNPRASEKLLYLDGPGGTGKTYLYNAIIDYVHSHQLIAMVVSSTGISAILLKTDRTAHLAFKIPIANLAHDSVCSLSVNSYDARFIPRSVIIIWDELGMMHRIQAVDRLYRDIIRLDDAALANMPFDGKTVLVGGDFKQVLPVIPRASRSTIVSATLPHSPRWQHLQVRRLRINMRIERLRQTGADTTSASDFTSLLLRIGTGQQNEDGNTDDVQLPLHMCIEPATTHQDCIQSIINTTYPDFQNNYNNVEFLLNRAILAPKNDVVAEINNRMMEMLPGTVHILRSVDTMSEGNQQAFVYPTQFLNSLARSGMPPHALHLKVGMPVLLNRNLKPKAGLCNGVRLIVRDVGQRVVRCEIAVGAHAGTIVALPRIITSPTDSRYPFVFQRLQFPVQPAFALTIKDILWLSSVYPYPHRYSRTVSYTSLCQESDHQTAYAFSRPVTLGVATLRRTSSSQRHSFEVFSTSSPCSAFTLT